MTAAVVWVTGLPASGKSTLAGGAAAGLRRRGAPVCVLDSDAVRAELSPPLGYSDEDRAHFYRTLSGLAALIAAQGITALVPATANRTSYRDAGRERARARGVRFFEVLVDAPVEECARRDPKGLYAAARAGDIGGLPGVEADYERPEHPDVVARGGDDEGAVRRVVDLVLSPG